MCWPGGYGTAEHAICLLLPADMPHAGTSPPAPPCDTQHGTSCYHAHASLHLPSTPPHPTPTPHPPQAGALIESRQLYKACCLLDSISEEHITRLMDLLAPGRHQSAGAAAASAALQRMPGGGGNLAGAAGAPGSPRGARGGVGARSDSVRFLHFLPQLVQDLTATAEHLAMADFNNWLVGGAGGRGRGGYCSIPDCNCSAATAWRLEQLYDPQLARGHHPLRWRHVRSTVHTRPASARQQHQQGCLPTSPHAVHRHLQVSVRAEAKQIGLRAIRRAAIERQLEDDLGRERRALLVKLGPACDLRQLAAELVAAPFRQELAREAAGEGDDTSAAAKWVVKPAWLGLPLWSWYCVAGMLQAACLCM